MESRRIYWFIHNIAPPSLNYIAHRIQHQVSEISSSAYIDKPGSTQMTESPTNTNTMSGEMRVEGKVTCPSKSTPTDCRDVAVMRNNEGQRKTMKNDKC